MLANAYTPLMTSRSLFAILLIASAAWAEDADKSPLAIPTITVHDEVVGHVDDRMFGSLVELTTQDEPGPEAAIDPATGTLRANVVAAILEIAPPLLRYPGGGLVESPGFRWTQLIDGPADGAAKDERRFKFGLNEFLDFCEAESIAPLLVLPLADQVRALIPPDDIFAAARSMAAYVTGRIDDPALPADLRPWVALRIANGRSEPWSIPYWQIGNEFAWVAVPNLRKKGWSDDRIATTYVDAVERTLTMIESLDPDAAILVENYPEIAKIGLPVTDRLRERLGDRIDYLSTHQYYAWGIDRLLRHGEPIDPATFTEEDYWNAAVSAPGTDERGLALWDEPLVAKTNAAGYPVALTEWNWNSWWQLPDDAKPPFHEPLWAKGVASASLLHGILRNPGTIALATQSLLVGSQWELRAIDARDGHATIFPTGAILALYRKSHGIDQLAWTPATPLPTTPQPITLGQLEPSAKVALLDCLFTRQTNGTIHAHFINRSYDETLTVPLDLNAFAPFSSTTQTTLTGVDDERAARKSGTPLTQTQETTFHPTEPNTYQINLPAKSVTIVTFTPPKS